MSVKDTVKRLLTKKYDAAYERALSVKKVSYDRWVREREQSRGERRTLKPEADLSAVSFVIWRQRRGRLAQGAEVQIAAFFADHPEVNILYGDEDLLLEDGSRDKPWYRPCWSPDTYRSFFYVGSVIAVRTGLLREAGVELPGNAETAEDFPGEQVFESAGELRVLMDRLFRAAGGFERGCAQIAHLEEILFHVEDECVWEEYLGAAGTEQWPVAPEGLVSVIIPSRDNPKVLEKCLTALQRSTGSRLRLEIIVVDNGSSPENRSRVESLTQGMKYCYEPAEFNFSAMCNRGAGLAQGRLLLFLNDDVEVTADDWLERMAAYAILPYAGAVGLKLYYPDSVRIQHDGIVNLPVGPVHKLQFFEDDKSYYFGRNRFTCNCIAVTGACLMMEAEKFWEAGGFPETLRVAYNDVALGFELRKLGYQNVVVNERHAFHHESLSRGSDESREKQQRLVAERELLYRMYPDLEGKDPCYPAGLSREGLDSRMTPAYVYAGNRVQDSDWKPCPYSLEKLRRDECLMVRVESSGPEKIQGYGVVLADDNACYQMYLLLLPEEEQQKPVYMRVEGQYRQDLEENLPDQKHVALDGFCVSRQGEKLPRGSYRIALLAVNRVTGGKLWNESGKVLSVT